MAAEVAAVVVEAEAEAVGNLIRRGFVSGCWID
jgi:hypothetical protein